MDIKITLYDKHKMEKLIITPDGDDKVFIELEVCTGSEPLISVSIDDLRSALRKLCAK